MKVYDFPESGAIAQWCWLMDDLLSAPEVHTGDWQAMDTSKSPVHSTHELEDVSLVWDRIPLNIDNIFPAIDLEWADEHFAERVSGQPMNPAPSHVKWPYAVRGNADHTDAATVFDHTYPERFWPKVAGVTLTNQDPPVPASGIRFPYGDLDDVVNLLVKKPLSRQAYLPIFFPEDTGAVGGSVRVPCTLGYHFMQRGGRLSLRYYLRSCDAYRHLSNDVYLAARLLDWMVKEVNARSNGALHFRNGGMVIHISSLHSFVGDKAKMRKRLGDVMA